MTPEPRHSPIVPSYGAASLADLSSSMLASLDPEAPESQNVLGLAPARRACLLIVDGAGLGTAPRPSRRRAVPLRTRAQLQAHHGRIPVHHGHQPRLDLHRAAARPARDARLSGHRPGRESPAQRAALGFAGRSPAVAAAAHHLRAGHRGGHRGRARGPGCVPRHRPDRWRRCAARTSGRPTAWAPWPRRPPRPLRRTGARS